MSTLVTFPGKFGDILWSLPTARALSRMIGEPVVFAMMPQYAALIPLLEKQSYIQRATVFPRWFCTGSPHGDQPWLPPTDAIEGGPYDRVFHLGYRGHPGMNGFPRLPLMEFTASQQGLSFVENPIPFLDVEKMEVGRPYVAYAFNQDYAPQKQAFLAGMKTTFQDIELVDVATNSWLAAAMLIKGAVCFIGCRSANYVLAHGVGQRCLIYEPHPGRWKFGAWGDVFSCKPGREEELPRDVNMAVGYVGARLRQWNEEMKNENAKAIAG